MLYSDVYDMKMAVKASKTLSPEALERLRLKIQARPELIQPNREAFSDYAAAHPVIIRELWKTGRIPVGEFYRHIHAYRYAKNSKNVVRMIDSMPENVKRSYNTLLYLKRYHKRRVATSTAPCVGLRAEIYAEYPRMEGVMYLPRKRIDRSDAVRYYDPIRVTIKRGTTPVEYALKMKTHPISECIYAPEIDPFNGWTPRDKLFVLDGRGDIVAAATLAEFDNVLEVVFLCSANLCSGAGTMAMRAAQGFAQMQGYRKVHLVPADDAVGFYRKIGYTFRNKEESDDEHYMEKQLKKTKKRKRNF